MEIPAITVKTLLGRKSLQFSIDCLKSFTEKSADKILLQIFEDGTLEESDVKNLENQLDNVVIVSKRERDIKLRSLLKNYPLCFNYRQQMPYAQKVFDIMLYDNEDLLFIDSDIFFLKKFILPQFNQTPTFISDTEHAYSFTPVEFLKISIPIYPRINSGLFYFPKSLFSLDFIESLLKDEVIQKGLERRISWLEQTIWSFLAAKGSAVNYFDKRQIIMAENKLKVTNDTVAVHLVSTYRHHFSSLKDKLVIEDRASDFAEVKLRKQIDFLNKHEFAFQKLIKKAKRELGIM